MTIQRIKHQTEYYEKMIDLRIRILLDPIGVPASFIKPDQEKNDILIGAFEKNELIGCAVLTKVTDSTVQLRQMAVKPAMQGKGLGRALVNHAEKLAKEKGYQTAVVHTRDAVIAFYEKCGYTITDEGFTEVGIPHHRMEKALHS